MNKDMEEEQCKEAVDNLSKALHEVGASGDCNRAELHMLQDRVGKLEIRVSKLNDTMVGDWASLSDRLNMMEVQLGKVTQGSRVTALEGQLRKLAARMYGRVQAEAQAEATEATAETAETPGAAPKFKIGDKIIRDLGDTYCEGIICSVNKDENGYWSVRCGGYSYRTHEDKLTLYPHIADPDSWELDGLEKRFPKKGERILGANGRVVGGEGGEGAGHDYGVLELWIVRKTLARKIADAIAGKFDLTRIVQPTYYVREFIAPIIHEHKEQ